uniref:Family with sequence similarity 189, member B n=1 Tax=Nothobranchius pienaari TaxID=704102 RepID=A0A1A8LVQ3_9TELE
MSDRAPGGARLLLYLGLCHLGLGAMVLAFSFTSMAFTSSARVRQSCPFWAGFFVVASGIVGIISWRRPLTLVVSLFMLLSAVCVILSLAGSMLSCQNAQMVKSMLTCQVENGLCVCCSHTQDCSIEKEDTLVLYLNVDCHAVRHQLKDLLFSACGLSILSTIICTLSTVTCSIHIFSLDLVHLLAPHRSRSVNPECTTPQDAFLTNIMDFEEFVPPIPPPPYYPPEYTCSSETDAQSITYNGSMESPVPLYPTDCPPPYEAVMGQRAASQATVFDPHGTELSGERGTSTAFSGEVSMDSGSLLMSEIVDIPDDSSPSEDSCLLEVGLRNQGERGNRSSGDRGDMSLRGSLTRTPESPLAGGPRARRFLRGERSNSCSSPSTATTTSPVLHRQVMLTSSCSQLETISSSSNQQRAFIPEIRVNPSTPLNHGGVPATSVPHPSPASAVALPSKGSMKPAASGVQVPSKPVPTSPLRLPKDCHRSLGDLKVTRVLVARFLQRSKRNLSPSTEHVGSSASGPKRRGGAEAVGLDHVSSEQVLRTPWGSSRGHLVHRSHHPHRRGHHYSHSDSRHNRHQSSRASEGIHLRSCGDLSSSSASLLQLVTAHHGSSGALHSESAL